jgi:hypothetical protein
LITAYYPPFHLHNSLQKVVDSPAMEDKRFQQIKKRLNEQAKAT